MFRDDICNSIFLTRNIHENILDAGLYGGSSLESFAASIATGLNPHLLYMSNNSGVAPCSCIWGGAADSSTTTDGSRMGLRHIGQVFF